MLVHSGSYKSHGPRLACQEFQAFRIPHPTSHHKRHVIQAPVEKCAEAVVVLLEENTSIDKFASNRRHVLLITFIANLYFNFFCTTGIMRLSSHSTQNRLQSLNPASLSLWIFCVGVAFHNPFQKADHLSKEFSVLFGDPPSSGSESGVWSSSALSIFMEDFFRV